MDGLGRTSLGDDRAQFGGVCGGVFVRGYGFGGCASAVGDTWGFDEASSQWRDVGGDVIRGGGVGVFTRRSLFISGQWEWFLCGIRAGGGGGGVGGDVGEAWGVDSEVTDRTCVSFRDDGYDIGAVRGGVGGCALGSYGDTVHIECNGAVGE